MKKKESIELSTNETILALSSTDTFKIIRPVRANCKYFAQYDDFLERSSLMGGGATGYFFQEMYSPFGKEGDKLWVKEPHGFGPSAKFLRDYRIYYLADGENELISKKVLASKMQRHFSRIELEIVRINPKMAKDLSEKELSFLLPKDGQNIESYRNSLHWVWAVSFNVRLFTFAEKNKESIKSKMSQAFDSK